ncbi:MAG TPA: hypothetical protein VFF79_12625 [Conexibacter sp.]|jgi:hypothetical protein|nr:hypothetical protein [Conexibacter sp.]
MTTGTIDLANFRLARGKHSSITEGGCLLELCSFMAREPWSDHPKCVSPVLGAFGRRLNDDLGDAERQLLTPYAERMLNTAGDGQDEARGWLAADWPIRNAVYAALRPRFDEVLKPTIEKLLPSALDLLDRMIDPSAAPSAQAAA